MGLFSFFRGQFIEVIEWVEDTESLVYRFPAYDNAIKMGAQLTVREGQAAIFLNEGTIADVFAPGRYELSTQNMPILTALRSWKHGFNSPFKAASIITGRRHARGSSTARRRRIPSRFATWIALRQHFRRAAEAARRRRLPYSWRSHT
jgi:membrane protease subunit (stomatin/prohibitin family)